MVRKRRIIGCELHFDFQSTGCFLATENVLHNTKIPLMNMSGFLHNYIDTTPGNRVSRLELGVQPRGWTGCMEKGDINNFEPIDLSFECL